MQMKVNAMALFYVYQNQTYQHEHDGGYVWSPQRAKSGGENQGYKIMTEISFLVYQAGQFIRPNAFLLLTFLLNCMLSVLIGTSFGTAATMGVICMSIGNVMGCSPVLLSGAVLSGIYFGDRCSPLSTSALVVATITKTNLFTIYLYPQPLWSWLRSCKA